VFAKSDVNESRAGFAVAQHREVAPIGAREVQRGGYTSSTRSSDRAKAAQFARFAAGSLALPAGRKSTMRYQGPRSVLGPNTSSRSQAAAAECQTWAIRGCRWLSQLPPWARMKPPSTRRWKCSKAWTSRPVWSGEEAHGKCALLPTGPIVRPVCGPFVSGRARRISVATPRRTRQQPLAVRSRGRENSVLLATETVRPGRDITIGRPPAMLCSYRRSVS